MQNPYYVPSCGPSPGLTEPVRDFVLGQPIAEQFLDFLDEFLDFAIPAYVGEGKTRLTIAIGCTGGFHRSIVDRGGARGVAARARLRAGRRSSTASSSAATSNLARAG